MARGFPRGQRQGPARQLEWSRLVRDAAVTGAIEHIDLIAPLESGLGRTLGDYTVTRTIITLHYQGGVALGEFCAGVCIDSRASPAFSPDGNLQIVDWMWIEKFAAHGNVHETAVGVFGVGGPYTRVHYDIASQRKCDQRVAPYFKLVNTAGTAAIVQVSINMLVKLA